MSGSAATTNPDFTAAWADDTGSAFTEGASDGALNGTNSVTLVAAPASSTRRVIKSITIENKDTAAVTITVSYNNNSTLRTIAKVTLNVGDTWTTTGTFDTNGSFKQTLGSINLSSGVTGTLPVANGGTGTTTGSLVNCTVDGTNPVGYRNIPQSGSAKTTSYTLATGDVGEFINVGTGGSVTIPNSTFAAGDVVSIFNDTSGAITITCTITTAYIAGTDADKATVSLATRGVATILFLSGTVCVINGNVS
tara:strand:- start:90 stop:842 length:753 start_codon:yes stop_codon:yes gene_type:complete